VERKLGIRTRVFLVLAVLAIGGAGAAIYLAIDTRDNAVSESDVQALQSELEARLGGSAAAGSAPGEVTALEAEVKALQAQLGELQGAGGKAEPPGAEQGATGATGESPEIGPTGLTGTTKEQLEELRRRSEEAQEEEQQK
jgi:hypothetical protein